MYSQLNGRNEAFNRSNSICATPEENLLNYVLKNDTRNIERLLRNSSPELLSHVYGSIYNKPILLIACSEEQVEAKTVKTLIDLGADITHASKFDEEWQAIHFAAASTKTDTLKVVVDSKPENVHALAKGNNALHVLVRYGKSDSEGFVTCAKLLVEAGIDVNQADADNITPILWAAKKGYKEVIRTILECSQIPVDLDSHQSRKETARDLILRKKLYDGICPEKTDNNNEDEKEALFRFLDLRSKDAFLNYKNGDIYDFVNADNGHSTLLQISCEKCLLNAAQHLIDKGADPNLTTKSNAKTPVEICAENGFYEIFQALLEHPKLKLPRNVLITLLKNLDNQQFSGINHEECCDKLLNKLEERKSLIDDINFPDESSNSPLHYAVRYAEPDKIHKLLNLRASLGSKNKYGVMPIQDIGPSTLEKHLDDCIKFDVTEKKFEREDFLVTFDYHTLIPPSNRIEHKVTYEKSDSESKLNSFIQKELVAETEVISYMSKAQEYKHLLSHPVIVSFLFMKWHRIRWLFYINLAFYIAFCLSLVVYVFMEYICNNDDGNNANPFDKLITNLSYGILVVTYFVLIFRELFQIIVSPDKYFKNFENYVEIVLIVLTGCILFISHPRNDTRRILSSIAILLAAFELVLMVGQHPKLSTNVVMLETVSYNFFKFLMWYSLLIIAFALSFYILFTETGVQAKNSTSETDEEEDFFTDPGKSMFKTIVMLTGEFDAGSLKFDQFPITSKIMFALFVFMIAIILLNLLNGLAVSDTQQIKNNAELVGHIARAQHIQYVESMVLGNLLPTNFIKRINKFFCCFPDCMHDREYRLSEPLVEKACLYPVDLGYELKVYPNKNGEIFSEDEAYKSRCTRYFNKLNLDKETIKRTNRIIREKRERHKMKKEEYLVKILEELLKRTESDRVVMSDLGRKMDEIMRHIKLEPEQ